MIGAYQRRCTLCYVPSVAKLSFGRPLDDDDILEVQGIEYPMNPIGMRAMRKLLDAQKMIGPDRKESDPLSEAELDVAIDMVVNAVRPSVRDQFREHIEESVPPGMILKIAEAVMKDFSDTDPTQPESSSGGSSETGSASTDGAPAAASTPVA